MIKIIPFNLKHLADAFENEANLRDGPSEFAKAIKRGIRFINKNPSFLGWINIAG